MTVVRKFCIDEGVVDHVVDFAHSLSSFFCKSCNKLRVLNTLLSICGEDQE